MSHARQHIREYIVALLSVAPETYGAVFNTRIPKKRVTTDFLLVFSDGETSERSTTDYAANYERRCNIAIIGHLRLPGNADTATVEDKMDAMAAEIETKLTFGALETALNQVLSLSLVSTEMVVMVDEDDAPDHAELTMNYAVDYFTAEGNPAVLI